MFHSCITRVSQLGLSLLCDLRLINFCTFLPCQIGIEIPSSQVAVRMRTHAVKALQKMGTCCYTAVHWVSGSVLSSLWHYLTALLQQSYDMGTNVTPILQVRNLALCYHLCFGQDWLFYNQVTLPLLNPGSTQA